MHNSAPGCDKFQPTLISSHEPACSFRDDFPMHSTWSSPPCKYVHASTWPSLSQFLATTTTS
eukprot:5352093-Amphidinium_carterae.2